MQDKHKKCDTCMIVNFKGSRPKNFCWAWPQSFVLHNNGLNARMIMIGFLYVSCQD